MFITILKDLPALLFTFAAGSALLGLLIWVLAAQGAANRKISFGLWGLSVIIIVLGIVR